MDVTSVTKEDYDSKQLSTSLEGTFKRPISSPENAGTNNTAAIVEGPRRYRRSEPAATHQ